MKNWRLSFAAGKTRTVGYSWLALLGVAAFKLWVVGGEDIVGSATQYDALWFVRSASHWYWGTPYDWLAFVRPSAYPLFIAVVHLFHVPLRLAIELLQIGGAVTLVHALRRIGVSRPICVACFAAMLLHPIGFQLNDYTMADTLYAGLLPFVLALLILSTGMRSYLVAALTGVAIAVLWNTREEGILLIVLVIAWALAMLVQQRLAFAHVARLTGVVIAVAAFVITIVYTANYLQFRSFARSEMTARSFQTLFHALLRIQPAERKQYVAITTDTLHRAFRVSPTFAALQPVFDSRLGESWRVETNRRVGVPGEIGVGWIVWATRQAAAEKGAFASPDKAQRFFKKAAREINDAGNDGRLPTRFVLGGFLDPLAQSGAQYLPRSLLRIAGRFFARWEIKPLRDDEILLTGEASLYDRMTGRRAPAEGRPVAIPGAMERAIGRHYYLVAIALHIGAFAAAVWLGLNRGRRTVELSAVNAAIVLLAIAVLLRVALFTWLDTTAFDSTEDRFLFPVMPLWNVPLLLLINQAWRRSRPFARSDEGGVSS